MRIEQAQLVKAPREQVFQTWTDYDAYPRWSVLFPRVTVTERAGNTAHLDMDAKIMGRIVKRKEKHVLTPPEQVLVSGEHEGATTTTLWKFEPVPEGTLVTAVVEAKLTGLARLLGPLANRQVRQLLRQWLQAFAKYSEAKHPSVG
jgi:uncharacterized protein YndB with AHSA1/START domain